MKITWYGHSCFKLESSHGTIIFDPFENGYIPGVKDIPAGTSADEVICSHGHGDHSADHLIKLTGEKHSYQIKTVESFHDSENGKLRGKNNISIVSFENIKVVHFGDIGCSLSEKQIEILNGADVVMIPVGGYYTVDAAGAFEIVNAIGAKTVIPMHYKGNGFGFDEISRVDEFVNLFDNVEFLESNIAEISENDIFKNKLIVFKPR